MKNDSIQFEEHKKQIHKNFEINNLEESEIVLKKMLLLAKKTKKSTFYIYSYFYMGLVYKTKNNYTEAKNFYRKAMHIADSTKQYKLYADVAYGLGRILRNEGQLDIATKITYTALEKLAPINEGNNDEAIKLNFGLAEIEFSLKNYKKAIKIYENYLYKTPKKEHYLHGALGLLYDYEKEYDKAIYHHLESIKKYEKNPDLINNTATIYSNLGQSYLKSNQFSLAESSFLKAKQIIEKYDIKLGLGSLYYDLSRIENHKNNNSKEKELLKKAIVFAKNNVTTLKEAHFNLAVLYAKNNNILKKQIHLEHYNKINDSLFNLSRTKTIDELSTKYKVSKKELEIKRLEDLNNAEKKAHILYISFSSLLLLLLVALILLFRQRNITLKKLYKNKIKLKNEAVKNALIVLKNDTAKTEIKIINNERKRIARDLHESIAGNLAAIKFKLIESNTHKNLDTIIDNIDETYQSIRTISHNLKPSKFLTNSFSYLINQLCLPIKKDVEINVSFYPEKEINNIKELIQIESYKIIQEGLNNCIKHAEATLIEVSLTLHDDNHLNIIIEDNGVGFIKQKHPSGIGLLNIKERIEELNGNFLIDSKINSHTILNISIPNAI